MMAILQPPAWLLQMQPSPKQVRRCAFSSRLMPAIMARVNAATIIQDQLTDIGFEVEVEGIEFSALIPVLLGQEYDAIMIGWTNINPDTDGRSQFNPENDRVGAGFNFVSMNNPEMAALFQEALQVPGCDVDARAALYHQAQAIQHDELPYLFMYAQKNVVAVKREVANFDPQAENVFHNLGSWAAAFN